MPEPVELRLRRGERRGVAMAETDDRDAGEEVEVALPFGVDEPRAVAVGEGDVVPRIRRKHLVRARDLACHATTAVCPIVAVMPLAAASAAARSLGMIPPSKAPSASMRRASPTAIASTISSSM